MIHPDVTRILAQEEDDRATAERLQRLGDRADAPSPESLWARAINASPFVLAIIVAILAATGVL